MADHLIGPQNYAQYTQHEARVKFEQYTSDCIKFRVRRLGLSRGQQVRDFVTWLVNQTTWYYAPASTKYHLSVPGGLLIHSVGVCDTALVLRKALMPELDIDSIIFCSIFHDVGKIYGKVAEDGTGRLESRYEENVLKTTGRMSEASPYKFNKAGDNGIFLTIKDALLPLKFVDLSDAEIQALMLADGHYVNVNEYAQHKEHPLGLCIHWADYWQGHVIEGQIQASWLSGVLGQCPSEG